MQNPRNVPQKRGRSESRFFLCLRAAWATPATLSVIATELSEWKNPASAVRCPRGRTAVSFRRPDLSTALRFARDDMSPHPATDISCLGVTGGTGESILLFTFAPKPFNNIETVWNGRVRNLAPFCCVPARRDWCDFIAPRGLHSTLACS